MSPPSVRARGLAELNPALLSGRGRGGGLRAALRAAVALLRKLVASRGLS